MRPNPHELDLLRQAAAHAAAAAQLAGLLAGVDTEALDNEVGRMGDACEQALHSWAPPEGWHW